MHVSAVIFLSFFLACEETNEALKGIKSVQQQSHSNKPIIMTV